QEVESCEKLPVLEVPNTPHNSLEFGIRFSDETIDEEDEWCDFTDEHDQPFPNLKRGSRLILGSNVPAVAVEDSIVPTECAQQQDTGGDGLGVGQCTEDLGKSSCPWMKLNSSELSPCLGIKPVEAMELKAPPAMQSPPPHKSQPNMMKQVYVPPALRESQSDVTVRPKKQPPPMAVKLAKGQAPDLNNVDFFPSLCQSRISKRAK
ncbi:hypothetical protein KR222_011606, partial [Zaprionus bogoriensis]